MGGVGGGFPCHWSFAQLVIVVLSLPLFYFPSATYLTQALMLYLICPLLIPFLRLGAVRFTYNYKGIIETELWMIIFKSEPEINPIC